MSCKRDPRFDKYFALYESGLSLQQVADKVGTTRQILFKAFKRRGFKLREKNFRLCQFFDGIKFTLRNIGYYSSTDKRRIAMHRYVWEFYNGPIPIGYDIHHKDEDKSNNNISNLECLPKAEHTRKYGHRGNQYTKRKKETACG